MQCVISIEGPFEKLCTFISMICLIIKKARREGFVGKNKIIG